MTFTFNQRGSTTTGFWGGSQDQSTYQVLSWHLSPTQVINCMHARTHTHTHTNLRIRFVPSPNWGVHLNDWCSFGAHLVYTNWAPRLCKWSDYTKHTPQNLCHSGTYTKSTPQTVCSQSNGTKCAPQTVCSQSMAPNWHHKLLVLRAWHQTFTTNC